MLNQKYERNAKDELCTIAPSLSGIATHSVIRKASAFAAATFTAEELITKREMVGLSKAQSTGRLKDRNILVDEFNIVNFEFSRTSTMQSKPR